MATLTNDQIAHIRRLSSIAALVDQLAAEVTAMQATAIPWDTVDDDDLTNLLDILNLGYCRFRVRDMLTRGEG